MCKSFKVNFLLIFLFSTTSFVFSQRPSQGNGSMPQGSGKITGILIDAQASQPIEYGNVLVFRVKDSVMVTGNISNVTGKFTIEPVPFGKYYLKIQFIGYKTKYINNVSILSKNPEVDLGKIQISQSASSLSAVDVVAQKEMITNNLDKKVINVDRNIASSGGTAIDVMQNLPSVSVESDGNISLRGNTNVTILIDGKPSGMANLSASDALSQIPASSIESVELVTNPSVRYDPEGTSGIINIVLKKKSLLGLNGMVQANAGTGDKYSGTLNLNYRNKGLNLFGNMDLRQHRSKDSGTGFRTTEYNNIVSYLSQHTDGTSENKMYNINVGADYYLNDRNSITLQYQNRHMDRSEDETTDNLTKDSAFNLKRNFDRNTEGSRKMRTNEYTLNYKRTFEMKGKELTADFIVSDNSMDGDEDMLQREFSGDTVSSTSLQRSISDNSNNMYIAQANYVAPLGEGGRLEAGFKSSYRQQVSGNNLYNVLTNDQRDTIQRNHFAYDEQIHAIYGIYSNSIKKFKYQVGLRLEEAYTESELKYKNDKFDNNYFSFYPSVHLVQEIGKEQEVQLSYSRRINRPNPRMMNPFVDYEDSLNVRQGNPKLKPEYINSFELGYSKYWGKTSFTGSVFYRRTDDVINSVSVLDSNNVTFTSYYNLSNNQSYGIELIATKEFFKILKINANYSWFKSTFDGSKEYNIPKTEDYTWTAKLNLNLNLSKDFFFQVISNYRAPVTMAQGKRKETYFTDVALRKDFLKGKLSVNARMSDVFATRKYSSETYGEGFTYASTHKGESQIIFLGISYKFNNYKQQKPNREANGEEGDMGEF
ncbi:MAG: TonB-dependent receptor [Lentimicrobiaceae bacterium]|nr:TonB-dependent receptor [Lentimicrobiaceae bacterium]